MGRRQSIPGPEDIHAGIVPGERIWFHHDHLAWTFRAEALTMRTASRSRSTGGCNASIAGIQSLTSNAIVIRFSRLRRSGAQPGTNEPSGAMFPTGGVTPPGPEKYGTFEAR